MKRLTAQAVLTLVGVVLVAACGSSDEATSTTSSSTTSTTYFTPPIGTVTFPAKLPDREPLPDCGQYDASFYAQKPLPPEDQKKLDCFWTAHDAGKPAEVRVIIPSIDSEAIPTIFRNFSNGKKERIVVGAGGQHGRADCRAFIKGTGFPACENE